MAVRRLMVILHEKIMGSWGVEKFYLLSGPVLC